MSRRVVHAGVLMSLGLGLAFVGLWVRSYWRCDQLTLGSPATGCWFFSVRGSFWCRRTVEGAPFESGWKVIAPDTLDFASWDYSPARLATLFGLDWSAWFPEFIIPHWVVVLLFMVAPIAWFVRHQRRAKPGACVACGYDLRGTPGGECPECGARRQAGLA